MFVCVMCSELIYISAFDILKRGVIQKVGCCSNPGELVSPEL